jgi:hypothetical protein
MASYSLTKADGGRLLETAPASLISLRLTTAPKGQPEQPEFDPGTLMWRAGATALMDPSTPVPRQLFSVIGCHGWSVGAEQLSSAIPYEQLQVASIPAGATVTIVTTGAAMAAETTGGGSGAKATRRA